MDYSQGLSLKVYSDTIYASNDYELFNRISYGITNNTNQKQLFIIDNKGLRYSYFSFPRIESRNSDSIFSAKVFNRFA